MSVERRRGDGLLSQGVYDHLLDAIVDRTYEPGMRLKEEKIAAELGVSRTPIREAFRMLERAGWLSIHPGAGAYVRQPSMQEIREIFEVRALVEDWIVRSAAERATVADRAELERIVAAGWAAVERNDLEAMSRLNSEFHLGLAKAARNRKIQDFAQALGREIRWYFSAIAHEIGRVSWEEHTAMLEAVRRSDPAAASEVMAQHIRQTREAFTAHLLNSPTTQAAL